MSATLRQTYERAPNRATPEQARALAGLAATEGTLVLATYDREHLGALSADGHCWLISTAGTVEELSGA